MQDIKDKLDEFERKGYWFLPEWTMEGPPAPERIRLPGGEILPVRKILSDEKYREAAEYYDLIRGLDADERYRRYDFSFWDDDDLRSMRSG